MIETIFPATKTESALNGSLATREEIVIVFGPKFPFKTDETAAIGVELGGILRKSALGFMVPKRVLIVGGVHPLVFVMLIPNSLYEIHLPQ